jgi:hypothetical protein
VSFSFSILISRAYASSGGRVGKVGKVVGDKVKEGACVAVAFRGNGGDAVEVFVRDDSSFIFVFIQLVKMNKTNNKTVVYFFDVNIYSPHGIHSDIIVVIQLRGVLPTPAYSVSALGPHVP